MKRATFYVAWLTFAFNYLSFGFLLIEYPLFGSSVEYLWYLPFITGAANFGVTIFLSANFDTNPWRTVTLGISGLTWFFPPLMFTVFGIPFLIVYLIFSLQLLTSRQLRTKINAR